MGEFIILSLKVLMQISSKFMYFGLPEECISSLILLKLLNFEVTYDGPYYKQISIDRVNKYHNLKLL